MNERLIENNILIYPNPGTGRYTIDFMDQLVTGYLRVFNFQGSMLYQTRISGAEKLELSLSQFENGIYLVNIVTKKTNSTIRVIKTGGM